MKILEMLRQGWHYCVGPLNPHNDKFNTRTRFKMAMLSFFLLAIVFVISFYSAVRSVSIDRTQVFLDFAMHISYVLGAVVASYVGMESVFPSIGGYGWRGRGGYGAETVVNVFKKAQEQQGNPDEQPPVSPDHNDAEVD